MASICKRRNGSGFTFKVTIRLKDFPVQCASFDTQEEAEKWADQIENAIKLSKKIGKEIEYSYTFSDAIDMYKKEHLSSLSSTEYKKRESQLDFWNNEFSEKKLKEITPFMIENVIIKLSKSISVKNKKELSPKTCQRRLAALSHVFTLCVCRWRILDKNPMDMVEKPATKNTRRTNSREELSADEVFSWLRNHSIDDKIIEMIKSKIK